MDELAVSPWPLYEQLVRLVAEENAIADTLFQLGRALNKDVINLDMYLKVRFVLVSSRGVTACLPSR